jgi:predicted metalloprotease with PDZ domain
MKRILFVVLLSYLDIIGFAQTKYRYSVDFTKAAGNAVDVELFTPKVNRSEIRFYFPAIIPGTYAISDFGRFVQNLKAFDKSGKELRVSHIDVNTWKIEKANLLYRVTYRIEDTWHSNMGNMKIYPMAGTNIEPGSNFVVNAPGYFGYFDGLKSLPVELEFKKPSGFYGSSALTPSVSTVNSDMFQVTDISELYDSPIIYCQPDTASINLGSTQVLVSVYSDNKKALATTIARELYPLLTAVKSYLGGKLPVKKYAFIYSFNGGARPAGISGALEHNYSSFYSLSPMMVNVVQAVKDMSAHEFFHILTPLSCSSKEIKEFNYQQPVLSKHLWLYEGSTEYDAHHLQVKYGLTTTTEFLNTLASKIRMSRTRFNDSISFTELSKEVATTYADQYGNVYMKGALIAACLDIYLLHLSQGNYGLANLKHDLGIKFGKEKYFNDSDLFDEIAKLSFPEVKEFLIQYVAGNRPIDYTEIFALAGVRYSDYSEKNVFSIGNIGTMSSGGKIKIINAANMDDFGKAMQYKLMDEIVAIGGQLVTSANFDEVLDMVRSKLKEGDTLTVTVNRKGNSGEVEVLNLSAPVSVKEIKKEFYKIELIDEEELTTAQRIVRNAWLKSNCN